MDVLPWAGRAQRHPSAQIALSGHLPTGAGPGESVVQHPGTVKQGAGGTRPSVLLHLQGGDEGLLRDLHLAELAHLLLALLLLLEELALAGDVAAVALRQHVLPERADGLARDDAAADRSLDGDLEEVGRDQLLELLAH